MNTLRRVSLVACGALAFAATLAEAYNVYRLGGEDGNSWSAAISYEPGEYLVVGADGQIQDRVPFSTPDSHPTWNDTLMVNVDSTGGLWMRPFWVPDTLNLAQDGVRNRIPRGLYDNIAVGGGNHTTGVIERIRPMFDGDPQTAAFFAASSTDDPEIRSQFVVQNLIVDLGADYPINRVRFFPRLSKNDIKIDQIIAEMAPPKLDKESLGEEDFSDNSLPWFEIAGANSVQNFAAHASFRTTDSPWFKGISPREVDSKNDSRLTILRRDTENQETILDARFPLQSLQWVTIRPLYPTSNWEIAEFQIFGKGYVPRAIYTSAVLDFGEEMAWGKIRWKGDRDPGSKILIRTRSGSDSDPNLYWLPSEVAGEFKAITRQEYERGNIKKRFTTLDERHWSFWSAPYPWEAGLADPAQPPQAWVDGTEILSPGPSRYFQFQLLVLSTVDQSTKLQELEIQFARPAALEVVGEIWPLDASRTESTAFTYSVLPTLEAGHGFDRLEIFTLTRANAVRSVRVDGVEVSSTHPPEILDDRIVIGFPKLAGQDDTFKLIEVEFDARVVRYGTQFQGWIFDSTANEVKQLISPGDATVDFPGNALGVRTVGLGDELLAEVEVAPNPFTPNGDGINDWARFQFQLHEVSTPRMLTVNIYDLSGRRVRQLQEQNAVRGLFGEEASILAWDGMDDQGTTVRPGIYVYRIALDADRGEEVQVGTLSLAY